MCNCSNIPSFCQIIKDPSPVFWYFVGWWCEYPSLIELGRTFACTRTIYPPVNLSQFPSAQVEKKLQNQLYFFFSGRFLTTFFQKLKRFQKKQKKTNLTNEVHISTHAFSPQTHEIRFYIKLFSTVYLYHRKADFFLHPCFFFFKCLNCNLPD